MKPLKNDRRAWTRPRPHRIRRRRPAGSPGGPARPGRALRPLLEAAEARQLLSAGPMAAIPSVPGVPTGSPGGPAGFISPSGLSPSEIANAYGFDRVRFGTHGEIAGDGTGQTIAIVVAYHDPNIVGDLTAFDNQFGLVAPPVMRVIAQDGSLDLPGPEPASDSGFRWSMEESMDVEWAHAMAPGADLLVVEAADNYTTNYFQAVRTAASQPGVSAVSMSYGAHEYPGETGDDTSFTTPAGHQGVTFVAASGDTGVLTYPAASPNVLAVGGTSLTLNAVDAIASETGWSGSGGGASEYEPRPAYQAGVVPFSLATRAGPDVSYDADPNTGFAVLDSLDYGSKAPWAQFGGTSAGAPQWAALIAIADQGRALEGLPTLDGPSQTLPRIYAAPASDFNDILTGSTGTASPEQGSGPPASGPPDGPAHHPLVSSYHAAGPGYDLVTGRGTPNADLVVQSLSHAILDLQNGVLTIHTDPFGDDPDATASLYGFSNGELFATVDGDTSSFRPGDVTRVVIDADGTTNVVNIVTTAAGVPVTVNLLGSTNTVNIAEGDGLLSSILSDVTVLGGSGDDILNVDDQANAAPAAYSVTSSTITRPGAPTISYASVDSVNLYGGTGGNTYDIEGTPKGTDLGIMAGAGDDTVEITPTARNLDAIQGEVDVFGGAGSNALIVDDSTSNGGASYSLTSSTLTRTGAAPITYDSLVQDLTLDGGGPGTSALQQGLPGDAYTIGQSANQTGDSKAVHVNGRGGNDVFRVGTTSSQFAVSIQGGGGDDTVIGPNVAELWEIDGIGSGTVGDLAFSRIGNLVGGTANDTFRFGPSGRLLGGIDGGGRNDTLDYSGDGGAEATVDLATATATRTGGIARIQGVVGSTSAADTLIGPDTISVWSITEDNGGRVGNFRFSGVEDLTGGIGLDVFVLAGGMSVAGQIDGGGGGNDWLDLAAYTSPVAVNLATGTATGAGGGIARIRNVRGGQGGNTLTGDAQGNILIGGAGANTIVGGTGRSLLIGGKGPDTITGHSGADILIAGWTDYDASSLAHDLALESILAEWQSANSYATRIAHLENGGGLNGSNRLVWGGTVHDNVTNLANTLTDVGAIRQDWFFANPGHTKTNRKPGEQLD